MSFPTDRLYRVGIAGYLTYVHYAGLQPICGISHGCETVQTSRYANLAGVPVALLGLIVYIGLLASQRLSGERVLLGGYALTLIAFAFSAYLTYRERFTIHDMHLVRLKRLRFHPSGDRRNGADSPDARGRGSDGGRPGLSATRRPLRRTPPACSRERLPRHLELVDSVARRGQPVPEAAKLVGSDVGRLAASAVTRVAIERVTGVGDLMASVGDADRAEQRTTHATACRRVPAYRQRRPDTGAAADLETMVTIALVGGEFVQREPGAGDQDGAGRGVGELDSGAAGGVCDRGGAGCSGKSPGRSGQQSRQGQRRGGTSHRDFLSNGVLQVIREDADRCAILPALQNDAPEGWSRLGSLREIRRRGMLERSAPRPITFDDLRHAFDTLAVEVWPMHQILFPPLEPRIRPRVRQGVVGASQHRGSARQ
jgi:hypothetical protein